MNAFIEKSVPVYEFDEHNESFYFWHKAKYEGCIEEPLDLFHIDAHSDTGLPRVFKKPVYLPEPPRNNYLQYYRDFSKNELEIGNFIMPAVLAGLIKNIYFIYPKWRRFKPVRRRMNISSAFGEGRVLKYDMNLEKSPDPKALFKALPDLKQFNYQAFKIDRIPKKRKVILDIDLDYFACRDSVSNNLKYELEITKEQFLNRQAFLGDKAVLFSGLDFGFAERDKKYYCKISPKKVRESSYLPPKEEIESEIEALVSTLERKQTLPAVVTICKSCISGYCPDDYYGFIAQSLKKRLGRLLNRF